MLSWLKGGPAASASHDANMFGSTNHQDLRSRNSAAPQDEDAYTDMSSEDDEDVTIDDIQPQQTPAPMFALKAIRTVVWGTPAPPKPRERPTRRKKASPRSKRNITAAKEERDKKKEPSSVEQKDIFASTRPLRNSKALDSIPFRISPKLNLFDPSSSSNTHLPPVFDVSTPTQPSSPSKGILMTPGTALARKKAVSFHPSIGETTPPPKNYIRSGLPEEFPGKFPSPWPKGNTPQHRRSMSVPGPESPTRTLTFEEGPLNLDKRKSKGKKPERSTASNPTGYYEVGEDSRIADYLDDSDDERAAQQLQMETSMHEVNKNINIDMDAPRSSSAQFWKERTQKVEAAALEKIDKLKARCKIATGYAKKKDELCVDLAEKMREVMEKNKRLKAELKRISSQSGSTAGNYASNGTTSSRATGHSHALEEVMNTIEEKDAQIASDMAEKAHMENVIQRYKEKLGVFEEMLNNRENKITELSMSMYTGHEDEDLGQVVIDLKKKLRAAKQEVKELGIVKQEARNLRVRVDSLEHGFMNATEEKKDMEQELGRLRAEAAEMGAAKRSQSENRLRQQIEVLEKAKRDLRAEMKEKALADAKDRRESERQLKADLAELRAKVGSGWSVEKLEFEAKDLKEYATRLERELETIKKENNELKKKLLSDTPAKDDGAREWQMKQRSTLQELRRAKEEASILRTQKAQVEERLKDAKIEIETLKEARVDARPGLSLMSTPNPAETKGIENTSDDSAVDGSFDRWAKAGADSIADVSSFTPRAKSHLTEASTFNFNSPPVPALANRQKRSYSDEISQKENTDIMATPPDLSSFMQTPKASENTVDEFYSHRRQKESPRPKIVHMPMSPPVPASTRKVSGVGRVVPRRAASGGAPSRLTMDPTRKAAAEQRLADRKRAKNT
ncbi:hypothetical protein DFP73DRAFT_509206 [Morchella snyderi]|nr:hypothetical protein DFP73DRAFT_509206 [Morchella snyderi]